MNQYLNKVSGMVSAEPVNMKALEEALPPEPDPFANLRKLDCPTCHGAMLHSGSALKKDRCPNYREREAERQRESIAQRKALVKMKKTCKECKVTKPLVEFAPHAGYGKTGREARCYPCHTKWRKSKRTGVKVEKVPPVQVPTWWVTEIHHRLDWIQQNAKEGVVRDVAFAALAFVESLEATMPHD